MNTPQTPVATDRAPVMVELAKLDRQERDISTKRNRLHQRIDSLYLAAPLTPEQTTILDELEAFEQQVSFERQSLHRRIDELRQSVGLPAWRDRWARDDR
jgi:hypothetical protein